MNHCKNFHIELRAAKESDIPSILRIMDEARHYQAVTGNPQWRPGYPGREDILHDINSGAATVILADGQAAGYAALLKRDEAYDALNVWEAHTPYLSIHRLAIGDTFRGCGLTYKIYDAIAKKAASEGIEELRLDTGHDNQPMQHICARTGWQLLGAVEFPWGPRLVYRLPLK